MSQPKTTDVVTIGTAMGTLATQMGVRSAAAAAAHTGRDLREEVGQALERLYVGINELYRGNPRVLTEVWLHAPEVTSAGPADGEIQSGWERVRAEMQVEAQFRQGWQLGLDDVVIGLGADVAWATCAERGIGRTDDGQPVDFRQRSTNVLRLDAGEWKLVHRHVEFLR